MAMVSKQPAPIGSRARSVIATGLTIVLLAVSSGVSCGGYGLLLCHLGLLTGVNLMAVGIWMADNPSTMAAPRFGVLVCFLRRNLTVIGLMASSAVTAVAGEANPALCIGFFVLLLLGLSMTISGVLGLPPLARNGEVVVQEAA